MERRGSILVAGGAALGVIGLVFALQSRKRLRPEVPTTSLQTPTAADKFLPKDGITFYFFPRSPCARRVWVTLLAKKLKVNMVMVDLMKGEQRNPAFLAINPQGKVPAIRCHNHPTVPDCILYESQAIVEWLDEQFPDSLSLYPKTFQERLECKQWQYWELSMAEDMWPLSRQQVDGIIWRFTYSRISFYQIGPPKEASSDPFYAQKVKKVYEGNYLTKADARRRALRVLRAFQMLELALSNAKFKRRDAQQPTYLVGTSFTQADVACYPRLCKVPQNGLVSSAAERAMFPNVCEYFAALRKNSVFQEFADVDETIWRSGEYPLFVPQWWGKVLPWWLVVAVGKWRAGRGLRDFERITQASLGEDAVARHLALVTSTPLCAIPSIPVFSHEEGAAAAKFRLRSPRKNDNVVLSDNGSQSDGAFSDESWSDLGATTASPGERNTDELDFGEEGAGISTVTLYHYPALPLAVAARACLHLQSIAAETARQQGHHAATVVVRNEAVDLTSMANLSPHYLQLMPMGEVPVLVHGQRVVFGPHIIVEYIDEMLFSKQLVTGDFGSSASEADSGGGAKNVTWAANADPSASSELSCRLLPSAPIDRAIVRRWFGWCRTAYFYQIEPLYNARILPKRVRENGCHDADAFLNLAASQGVTAEEAHVVAEKCFGGGMGKEEDAALVSELLSRIDTVESELRTTSREKRGRSLLGHAHFTYADYFVLAIVLLAEVYSAVPLSAAAHPFVYAWKQALLRDKSVALLYLEMCSANGYDKHN